MHAQLTAADSQIVRNAFGNPDVAYLTYERPVSSCWAGVTAWDARDRAIAVYTAKSTLFREQLHGIGTTYLTDGQAGRVDLEAT